MWLLYVHSKYIYTCTSTSLNVRQPWCCMQHVGKQTAYSGDLWTIFHDHPVKGSAGSSAEKGHCLRPKTGGHFWWKHVKTWKSGGFSENAWKLRLLIYFDADFTVVDDEKWTRHDLDVGPIGWIGTLVFPWFRRLGVVASGLFTRRSCVLKSRDWNVSGSCLISIRIVATFPSVVIDSSINFLIPHWYHHITFQLSPHCFYCRTIFLILDGSSHDVVTVFFGLGW